MSYYCQVSSCIFILFGQDVLHKIVLIVELCCVAVNIHGYSWFDEVRHKMFNTNITHLYILKSQINVLFATKGIQHSMTYNDCLN